MTSKSSSPACAHCGKSAERACTGCKDAPAVDGDVKPTHYCSSACQKEDSQYRKALCKTEGRLIVYEGRYKPRITAEMDCLIPFPAKLCQAENDKKSVLVHLVCDDASAWLQDILKYILTGKHPFIRRVKRAFCKASTNHW